MVRKEADIFDIFDTFDIFNPDSRLLRHTVGESSTVSRTPLAARGVVSA